MKALLLLLLSAASAVIAAMGPAGHGQPPADAASSNDTGLPFSESKAPKDFTLLVNQMCNQPNFFVKHHGPLSFLNNPAHKCCEEARPQPKLLLLLCKSAPLHNPFAVR